MLSGRLRLKGAGHIDERGKREMVNISLLGTWLEEVWMKAKATQGDAPPRQVGDWKQAFFGLWGLVGGSK